MRGASFCSCVWRSFELFSTSTIELISDAIDGNANSVYVRQSEQSSTITWEEVELDELTRSMSSMSVPLPGPSSTSLTFLPALDIHRVR